MIEMNGKHHFIFFSIIWIGMVIWRLIIQNINWYFMIALWFGFLVTNPDIDLLLSKIFKKQLHRWWFTHSIAYPLVLYLSIKYYINMELAQEFGLILFIPVMIHLIADFQVKKLLNEDKKDTAGTWQISLFPFRRKRLNPVLSYCWMFLNLISVVGYSLWTYSIFPF